ncbi:MAG: hypothetical protein B7Y53_01440 [Halothiobacillus sp. 28-55-5]|nr:MAG: hypothetical protein B7Y53_01440 [Halothiobacillus sp. 28-55-5]
MLISLTIRHIALIDELELHFAPGMTTLTGETGAGKSILIDAIGLIQGDRANIQLIRAGCDEAEVIGVFSFAQTGPVAEFLREQAIEDDELIIRRSLNREGRGKIWINGRPSPAALLKTLSRLLIDVHGQHQGKGKGSPANSIPEGSDGSDLGPSFAGAMDSRGSLIERDAPGSSLRTHANQGRYRRRRRSHTTLFSFWMPHDVWCLARHSLDWPRQRDGLDVGSRSNGHCACAESLCLSFRGAGARRSSQHEEHGSRDEPLARDAPAATNSSPAIRHAATQGWRT